jgi:hypothetical protein
MVPHAAMEPRPLNGGLTNDVQDREAGMANRSRRRVESPIREDASLSGLTPWPAWLRAVVSLAVVYHMGAVLAGTLGVPPSSDLERSVAESFTPYFGLVDLGYSSRYYAEPPATPVVTATLQFGEGRPDETIRLPGRLVTGPRMRHQRQLALANALFMDVQEAKRRTDDSRNSRLARGYARHLCSTRPGCQSVTLHVQHHLIPEPHQVREAMDRPAAPPFDLFDESLFTTPEWIGEFSCDSF